MPTQPKGSNIFIEQEHVEKGEMERGRMNHNQASILRVKIEVGKKIPWPPIRNAYYVVCLQGLRIKYCFCHWQKDMLIVQFICTLD